MSHKATNWLSELEASQVGASEFRVLFHLCDCHNAARGCFPTQAYLMDKTGASNGTVNNALNALEAKGLIRRHRTRDGVSKRQKPTRYILAFEMAEAPDPSPKSGDGNTPDPTPKTGDGAVSNLEGDPSPISGATRLQPTGEEPVSNQKRTKSRSSEKPDFKKKPPSTDDGFSEKKADLTAQFWAEQIAAGKRIPTTAISSTMAQRMLRMDLVKPEQLRAAGVIS
jgi:hypothetical protein